MAIKKTTTPKAPAKPRIPKTPAPTKTAASKNSKTPASKPLPTGEVEHFPAHAYKTDMGEGLPPQAPPVTATDKGK